MLPHPKNVLSSMEPGEPRFVTTLRKRHSTVHSATIQEQMARYSNFHYH
jgi:hypothetical protein